MKNVDSGCDISVEAVSNLQNEMVSRLKTEAEESLFIVL